MEIPSDEEEFHFHSDDSQVFGDEEDESPIDSNSQNEEEEFFSEEVSIPLRDNSSLFSTWADSLTWHSHKRKLSSKNIIECELTHNTYKSPREGYMRSAKSFDVSTFGIESTSNNSSSLNIEIHGDILLVIFSFLVPEDLIACSYVCKAWKKVSEDNRLWKYWFEKRGGNPNYRQPPYFKFDTINYSYKWLFNQKSTLFFKKNLWF